VGGWHRDPTLGTLALMGVALYLVMVIVERRLVGDR
jgi:hypothetical protein